MTLKTRLSPCITYSKVLWTPNELRRESETAVVEVSPADCSAAADFGVSWNRWRGHWVTWWAGCHPGSASTRCAWGYERPLEVMPATCCARRPSWWGFPGRTAWNPIFWDCCGSSRSLTSSIYQKDQEAILPMHFDSGSATSRSSNSLGCGCRLATL